MSKWLLRGLVFAALMVFIRLVQGSGDQRLGDQGAIDQRHPGRSLHHRGVRLGARRRPFGRARQPRSRPPRRPGDDVAAGRPVRRDRQRRARWLISLFYKGLYVGGLINELTTFAAFTALLTFLGAIAGVALGHWVIDRHADDAPRQHHGLVGDRRGPRRHRRVRRCASPGCACRRDADRAPPGTDLTLRGQVAQREQVALHTEPDDHAGGDRTQIGVVPELFAGMHVRDVHFDQRRL